MTRNRDGTTRSRADADVERAVRELERSSMAAAFCDRTDGARRGPWLTSGPVQPLARAVSIDALELEPDEGSAAPIDRDEASVQVACEAVDVRQPDGGDHLP